MKRTCTHIVAKAISSLKCLLPSFGHLLSLSPWNTWRKQRQLWTKPQKIQVNKNIICDTGVGFFMQTDSPSQWFDLYTAFSSWCFGHTTHVGSVGFYHLTCKDSLIFHRCTYVHEKLGKLVSCECLSRVFLDTPVSVKPFLDPPLQWRFVLWTWT